jgi:hypothetical protein
MIMIRVRWIIWCNNFLFFLKKRNRSQEQIARDIEEAATILGASNSPAAAKPLMNLKGAMDKHMSQLLS